MDPNLDIALEEQMRLQAVHAALEEAQSRQIDPHDPDYWRSVQQIALVWLGGCLEDDDQDRAEQNPFIPGARLAIARGHLACDEGTARAFNVDVDTIQAADARLNRDPSNIGDIAATGMLKAPRSASS